jgi:hypothetical protein
MTRIIVGTVRDRQSPAIYQGDHGEKIGHSLGPGTRVEASENRGQWLHLARINGTTDVSTLDWWTTAGPSQQYIEWRWETVADPGPNTDPELPARTQIELDTSKAWVFLRHDFQLGNYWGTEKAGRTRWYPQKHGDPETVLTFRKEQRVSLSPAWQDFHKLLFTLAAFGEAKLSLFPLLRQAFESTMAPNRVITNKTGFPNGYMPLLMAGNIARRLDERIYRPNAKFGESYKIETLNADKAPPDVEEVFWKKPWLWSKATIARYALPQDRIVGLGSPWQHVIPFGQLDRWNAHVPLLNISYGGWNYVQTVRCALWERTELPNPYNPALVKAFG